MPKYAVTVERVTTERCTVLVEVEESVEQILDNKWRVIGYAEVQDAAKWENATTQGFNVKVDRRVTQCNEADPCLVIAREGEDDAQ